MNNQFEDDIIKNLDDYFTAISGDHDVKKFTEKILANLSNSC